uniref:Ig-like domain-containing protein n=1 Tax=Amphiprion percula TaxID=161767 RepID=A0A3P8RUL4_AMPPE
CAPWPLRVPPLPDRFTPAPLLRANANVLLVFLTIALFQSFSLELPVIQSHPSTLDVILNNPITLPCRATGSPRPTITWQKEGGSFTVLPNGSLQISKASLSDSGMYICVAQNPAGTALVLALFLSRILSTGLIFTLQYCYF